MTPKLSGKRKSKEATMTFEEKLDAILEQFAGDLYGTKGPIEQIKTAIAEELPKEIHKFDDDYENGFNNCLSEVRKRLGIK